MSKKILTILIIVVTILIIVGVVLFGQNPEPPDQPPANNGNISQDTTSENSGSEVVTDEAEVTQQEPEVITSEIDTSGWLIYRNEEYGFEFRYPKEWGEAELLRGTQIRLYSNPENSGFFKILININNDKEEFQYVKTENIQELARVSISNGCNTSLSKNILLKNDKFLNVSISDPQEWLSQEECLKLYEGFPVSRKEIFDNPGSEGVGRVLLKEDEIPQAMRNDYELFREVMETFIVF